MVALLAITPNQPTLFALLVAFFLVVLHHSPSGDFLLPAFVPVVLLGRLFDVLIHPLLFVADTFEMLLSRHRSTSITIHR
jgi:hypothetical protein